LEGGLLLVKLISEITKNAREKIVAALDEYKGQIIKEGVK